MAKNDTYIVKWKSHKVWKVASFKKQPGVRNSLIQNKTKAKLLADDVKRMTGCEVKVIKVN